LSRSSIVLLGAISAISLLLLSGLSLTLNKTLLGNSTITRDQIIATAQAYAGHRWYCSASNTGGRTCANGCTVGDSKFGVGYQVGVAYKWGGFDTIEQFDTKLSQGYVAGDTEKQCAASCATGVDCSGFVSRCWGLTTHYTTRDLPSISTPISRNELKRGDILNGPGVHVVLFYSFDNDGVPIFYESAGLWPYKVWRNSTGGWSYINRYCPDARRYDNVLDTGPILTNTPGPTPTATPTPIVPTPTPAPTPPPGDWQIRYFNDLNLSGEECNQGGFYGPYGFLDWGDDSPGGSCNPEFSARVWRQMHFDDGDYTFYLFADDNAKLKILHAPGGDLIVDQWWPGRAHIESRHLHSGDYEVVVEYNDTGGRAVLGAWWQGPGFPSMPQEPQDQYQWYGAYWGNRHWWENAVFKRNEGNALPFVHDWGYDGPGYGLPADKFSTRFTRNVYFGCGRYRFEIDADDYGELWLDPDANPPLLHLRGAGYQQCEVDVPAGYHWVRVDHREESGAAHLRINWTLLDPCPTPTPTHTPTLTPTSTKTPTPTATRTPTPTACPNCGLADSPWPMFHHDLQHTGRSQYNGPGRPALKWSYSTGDDASSPAIGADGTLYVGLGDRLYAFNPDGTVKWSYPAGGYVKSPLVAADGTIYAGADDGKLYAINPNGSLQWVYTTGSWISASPALGPDGTIHIGSSDGKFYAINPDGSLKWSYNVGSWINSSPAIGSGGNIYFGSTTSRVYALSPDGSLKWDYTTGSYVDSSPAIGPDGTIYIGSCDNNLYALNSDGSLKWKYTTGDAVGSSPAIGADGTVYVGSHDWKLYAFRPDGNLKWSYTTGGGVNSSPAIGTDGTIYAASRDGKLYAFNPDGSLRWSYYVGGWPDSGPVIGADGTVYISSAWGGTLYAISEAPTPTATATHTPTPTKTPTPTVTPTNTATPTNEVYLPLVLKDKTSRECRAR